MAEANAMTIILSVACSLAALVLAWRAYRATSEDHDRRRGRRKDKRGDGSP